MENNDSTDLDGVSRILESVSAGAPGAESRLVELIFGELKMIAAARLRVAVDCSLSPPALVNEAWIKLLGNSGPATWNGWQHFFGAAASAMRQILIDHARTKRRLKRGGDRSVLELDTAQFPHFQNATVDDLLDLDEALRKLGDEDPALVKLVELKFFGGQTTEEAAKSLEIGTRTAHRHWQYAKARLAQLLNSERRHNPGG